MSRLSIVRPVRVRREYRADLELDGVVVGRVERAQDGRGGGRRASSYRAIVGTRTFAEAETMADLRRDLADPAVVAEIRELLR